MFNFERLEVWQKAVAYAGSVYALTKKFPRSEEFGLTAQIRRAANSISSNIAEGSARPPADFSRFLGYAAGSRNEGFLAQADYETVYRSAQEISRMLSGLRNSLGG